MSQSALALTTGGRNGLDIGAWWLLYKELLMKVFHLTFYNYTREKQSLFTHPIDIPITTPDFWVDESKCTEELLRHVFRSATDEEIPLFQERVKCLREAGDVLCNVRRDCEIVSPAY